MSEYLSGRSSSSALLLPSVPARFRQTRLQKRRLTLNSIIRRNLMSARRPLIGMLEVRKDTSHPQTARVRNAEAAGTSLPLSLQYCTSKTATGVHGGPRETPAWHSEGKCTDWEGVGKDPLPAVV